MTVDPVSRRIIGVHLQGPGVDDALFQRLNKLPQLQSLTVYRTGVTKQGHLGISTFPQLEKLGLDGLNVTDDTLRRVAELPKLRELRLSYAHGITGAELLKLKSGRPLLRVILD